MATQSTSDMTWDPWQPAPYADAEGAPMLMHGIVSNHYRGGIEAEGSQHVLIALGPDGTSTFTGLERVTGRVGDREGTFVLRISGSTAGGKAKAALTVVEGSGTGALAGISGEGEYFCDNPGPNGNAAVTLDHSFG
ncbi:hypothetical protein CG740_16880 [Streptomyces sp. CB01201]|uniref:DUF3224 domain-containing protein n=1 Tax=unclassified Streptomyces TaxID=2593676 RepID=UPI000C274B68|nr:DUF3224 domain-containing protein [Streptomyces sp. CB01201]PJN02056.1 hypothetical protein CG740_16880 [Streptomyces sp. CB01201]